MRDELERLLRAADVPNQERAQLLWDEYRSVADASSAAQKQAADGAFATLLAWYGGAIYRHIWGFIRSHAAEDVFQDVLRKLHEQRHNPKLARFNDGVLPWLRTVAIRECVSTYRRTTRRRTRETRAARPETDPESEQRQCQLIVADALEQLKPHHRVAIALHYFEGLDKQDAAAALGINRDTLADRLKDALDRLRQLIPASVLLAMGGALGVPTALSAQPPIPSAARLSELVKTAWGQATCGPAVGKMATVILVGLTLAG
ncbi:MAG TPA: sigma-70 family RNA polymerase sigma factor, partial [Gemmataceae bacterium]|nr:sigma-70 family RNA polymerase sigma factor [Gemmataceae bacterium]